MGDEGSDFFGDPRTALLLLGVGSAAVVVAIYHCIAVGWCNHHQRNPGPPQTRTFTTQDVEMHSSIEHSTVQLIPAHKFHKDIGLVGDDGLCAVCLCEFEEDEELRTLPECSHSYHASCIDMWLYSHSNCPVCRADAGLLPQIFRPPEINSEDLQSSTLQNVVIQSSSRIM